MEACGFATLYKISFLINWEIFNVNSFVKYSTLQFSVPLFREVYTDVVYMFYQVVATTLVEDGIPGVMTTSIPSWSTQPFPQMDSTDLQLAMRYNKEDNQQRCKG